PRCGELCRHCQFGNISRPRSRRGLCVREDIVAAVAAAVAVITSCNPPPGLAHRERRGWVRLQRLSWRGGDIFLECGRNRLGHPVWGLDFCFLGLPVAAAVAVVLLLCGHRYVIISIRPD